MIIIMATRSITLMTAAASVVTVELLVLTSTNIITTLSICSPVATEL